ncbi:class I SAM-dependent methyltransferase [Streptomyces sp. NPDC092296]|uniref:class I SAM-dependent methyltransferase n=1 Tax=Streptomyces sp. NPDC092296 TaxID=3366012 RepID=UPI003800D4B5
MTADDQPAAGATALAPVPQTALWTLYHRAVEARRPDALLTDPMAIRLVDTLDYPFAERFGAPSAAAVRFQARFQAQRVLSFDREVADFLLRHPRGTVVCLGEGLETQFWRIDNGRAQWLTVDLPDSVALRRKLLPPGPRQRLLACSATDDRWMREVDAGHGVLVTAQGLLMYLRPGEVRDLIAGCAEHFPGGGLVFDAVPRWFSRLAVQGKLRTGGFQAPPMPWGMDASEQQRLRTAHPAVVGVRDVLPPRGAGPAAALLSYVARVPVLRAKRPSVVHLDFAPDDCR